MAAERMDVDDWRDEIRRRVSDLEVKMGTTISSVERLMERQQLQHQENRNGLSHARESIDKMSRILVGERGDNGLIGTMAQMKLQVKDVKDSIDGMEATIKQIPKTVLTVLLILTATITLLVFLGPSIRKAIGLNAALQSVTLDSTAKPNNAGMGRIYDPGTGR